MGIEFAVARVVEAWRLVVPDLGIWSNSYVVNDKR